VYTLANNVCAQAVYLDEFAQKLTDPRDKKLAVRQAKAFKLQLKQASAHGWVGQQTWGLKLDVRESRVNKVGYFERMSIPAVAAKCTVLITSRGWI